MSLTETRIANARLAIERAGGVGKAAKAMGYANSSFLVQMFGPSPIRTPTEKTMRRMEQALGLRPFTLDQTSEPPAPPPAPAGPIDTVQLAAVLAMIGKMAQEEHVNLTPERLANLAAMGYEDSAEHGGKAREGRLRQVLQLLR